VPFVAFVSSRDDTTNVALDVSVYGSHVFFHFFLALICSAASRTHHTAHASANLVVTVVMLRPVVLLKHILSSRSFVATFNQAPVKVLLMVVKDVLSEIPLVLKVDVALTSKVLLNVFSVILAIKHCRKWKLAQAIRARAVKDRLLLIIVWLSMLFLHVVFVRHFILKDKVTLTLQVG